MASFTRDAILKTFEDMLEQIPFEKITVSAIIRECGISRNTFYYHFQDLYALLEFWLQQGFSKYIAPTETGEWQSQMKALLHACKERKTLIYHLFNSLSRDLLEKYILSMTDSEIEDYIDRQASGMDIPAGSRTAVANICRYVIVGYFLHFLWNDMNDDVDGTIDEMSGLFDQFVQNALCGSAKEP